MMNDDCLPPRCVRGPGLNDQAMTSTPGVVSSSTSVSLPTGEWQEQFLSLDTKVNDESHSPARSHHSVGLAKCVGNLRTAESGSEPQRVRPKFSLI